MSNIEVDAIPSPLGATFFALYAMCRCPIGFGDAGQRSNRCSHLSARLRVRATLAPGQGALASVCKGLGRSFDS